MKYKVHWSRYADESLHDILHFIIENDGSTIAFNIYNKIKKQTSLLEVSPFLGSKVEELKSLSQDYYQIIISSWKIIYRVHENVINILLVIDGRRDLEELLYDMIIKIDHM